MAELAQMFFEKLEKSSENLIVYLFFLENIVEARSQNLKKLKLSPKYGGWHN